jgi:hypothetical protein
LDTTNTKNDGGHKGSVQTCREELQNPEEYTETMLKQVQHRVQYKLATGA